MSSHAFRSFTLLGALLVSATMLPSALCAQEGVAVDPTGSAMMTAPVVMAPVPTATAVATGGPRIAPAGVTRVAELSSPETAPPQDHIGTGRNVTMMIVGGAALVVGLAIGGDSGTIIAVGGAVIGLIGLFRYLQ